MARIKYLFFLAISLSILISCGKDDDNAGLADSIVGLWKAESIIVTLGDETFDELDEFPVSCPERPIVLIQFNSSGSGDGETECQGVVIDAYVFRYKLSNEGKELTIIESGDEYKFEVKKLTSSKLVLSSGESAEKRIETWVRQ